MSTIRHYMNIVEGKVSLAERSGGFDVVGYFRYLKHVVVEILNLKKKQAPKEELVEKYKEMLSLVNNAKIQGKSTLPPEQYTDLIKQTNELVKQTGINTDQAATPAPAPAAGQAPPPAAPAAPAPAPAGGQSPWKNQNLPPRR